MNPGARQRTIDLTSEQPGIQKETAMTGNVGTVERVIRIVVGLGVLSLTIVGPATWWGLVGLVPLVTGLWGW